MNIPTPGIMTTPHDNNEGQRPPLIDEDGVMRIDNSSLEHFTSCSRSAEYYLVDGREPVRDRIAPRFGGAWHIVLEIYYEKFWPMQMNQFPVFLEAVRAELVPYFQRFPTPPDDYRTLRFLEDSLVTYVSYSEMFDDFELLSLPNGKLIEQYFEFPLGEVAFNSVYMGRRYGVIKVLWCGRIDLGIIRLGDKRIMDHKTTSMLGSNFYAEFMNSSPMLGYTWALEQIIEEPVAGLYLNALGIRKPSRSGIQFEVQRRTYDYDKERLEEWRYNTLVLVSDFLSHLDRGFFPQEFKWCVGKYGPCKYLDVCSMPPSQRDAVLLSNTFEKVTWTPKLGTRQ